MRKLWLLLVLFPVVAALRLPPGWRLEERKEFSKENLFQYLDGGAEKFLKGGFLGLEVYFLRKGKREAVLEVYTMKSREDALGFFKQETGEELKIGDNGRLQPNGIVFYYGNLFVKIYTYERLDRDLLREFLSMGRSLVEGSR